MNDNDKKRVLIVEDEEGLIEGLEHNFKFEGYDVMTARTGPEGLKLALKQQPDVVILDIMLPEKDGFTVLRELRQRHRDMPVLVLTARNFEADVLKGFDLGADDYLTKPFGVKELLARVRRLVSARSFHGAAAGTDAVRLRRRRGAVRAPRGAQGRQAGGALVQGIRAAALSDREPRAHGVARESCSRRSGASTRSWASRPVPSTRMSPTCAPNWGRVRAAVHRRGAQGRVQVRRALIHRAYCV